MTNDQITFTTKGVWHGFRQALPLALSVFAYGSVFGLLARQTGMNLLEIISMSGLVYAGSAQFIVLDLWQSPLPVLTIILTTLIVNLRHLLMGAALQPWFSHLPALQKYGSAFFMGDENWALSMREMQNGQKDAAFFVGGGLALYSAWLSASAVGYLVGAIIEDPIRWGLDFAFLAVFLALIAGMWRGKSDFLPWVIAAAVAIMAAYWLPSKWYILLGGLAGSLAGAILNAD